MGVKAEAGGGGATCRPCSRRAALAALGLTVLLGLLVLALGLALGLRSGARGAGPRRAVGGVAADHTACSQVGR